MIDRTGPQRHYVVSPTQWALFNALLNRPPRTNLRLRTFLSDANTIEPAVQPLARTRALRVNEFDSGVELLDTALKRAIRDDEQRPDDLRTRFFVTTAGGEAAVAYYSLRGCFMHRALPDAKTADPAAGYEAFVLLSRLAVDRRRQGQRLGTALLRDAVRRALATGARFGARALYVHALSEHVKPFYLERGFHPVPAIFDPLGVMVTFAEVAQALAD